jgi:hypothetical protein
MVLCLLYITCCIVSEATILSGLNTVHSLISDKATEDMALKALKIHNNLVTACRFGGIFLPQRGMWYKSSDVSSAEEHHEQCHR